MNRRKLIAGILAAFPVSLLAGPAWNKRTGEGFKVGAGEARFGASYKMKGVTLNKLDIKISGVDTDGDLAVFEQTGLTP